MGRLMAGGNGVVCAEAAGIDFPSFNLVQLGPKEVAGEGV